MEEEREEKQNLLVYMEKKLYELTGKGIFDNSTQVQIKYFIERLEELKSSNYDLIDTAKNIINFKAYDKLKILHMWTNSVLKVRAENAKLKELRQELNYRSL